jgi:hypothetical protein
MEGVILNGREFLIAAWSLSLALLIAYTAVVNIELRRVRRQITRSSPKPP